MARPPARAVILHDRLRVRLAVPADISKAGPVGQEPSDPGDRDVALEADQHVRDRHQPLQPGDASSLAK